MITNILVFLNKIKMKYYSKLLFLPMLILFINACEVENILTDDELIDAIINSEEKISVLENTASPSSKAENFRLSTRNEIN